MTYKRKHIVSFSNYMLSLVKEGKKKPDPSGELLVTHADVKNWKELLP